MHASSPPSSGRAARHIGQGKVVLSTNRRRKKEKKERERKNKTLSPSHQVRVCITTGNSCVVLGKQKNNNSSALG